MPISKSIIGTCLTIDFIERNALWCQYANYFLLSTPIKKKGKKRGYIHDIYALWGLTKKIGIIGTNETYQQNTNNKKREQTMTKKNITKNVKSVETISTADHAEPRMREEFAVFCNLLHGWFKQPERFEQFAARCAENAKVAVVVAIEKGIV